MSFNPRLYTSRRMAIVNALVDKLKTIDGSGKFQTDLACNAHSRLKFFDEINEWPAVHVTPGMERREYQGAGYKDRFLGVTVRCYVKEEDALVALERLLEDIETVIEDNGRLAYQDSQGASQMTHDITIVSIDTDEGVLEPLGVGEILLQVRY